MIYQIKQKDMNKQQKSDLADLLEVATGIDSRRKLMLFGAIKRANEDYEKKANLYDAVELGVSDRVNKIHYSDSYGVVYEVIPTQKDDWSIKYPYRIAVGNVVDGFRRIGDVCPSIECALVHFLSIKTNNQKLSEGVCKMLDIVTTLEK